MSAPQPSACSADDERALSRMLLEETRIYGIVFLEPSGDIRGWNPGAEFITGFGAADAIGRSASMLFTPEDRARGLDVQELRIAREVGRSEDERWHLRKDGSRVWTSGVTTPLRDEAGENTGFVKIFRDATHLRTRIEYVENVLRECTAQQDRSAYFLGSVAHELRNPLSPLKVSLSLLKSHADGMETLQPALDVMDRQIALLERLVEDLVDMTRVRSGKLSLTYSRVVVQQLVAGVVDASTEAAQAQGVTLEPVLPSVPLEVEVDAERLVQVVVNLVNNAIKYTPEGGSIWVSVTADPTHFFILVKDTGKGIGPELMPRVFDAFTQVEGADTHRGAGVGIGLAVVKEIVALHRGTVEVRSEGEGKGSEFTVRIPLRKDRDQQIA